MTPEENAARVHEKFHEDVQVLLIRAKKQQKQLAEALGMENSNLSNFLRKRDHPTIVRMCRIADMFGYKMELKLIKKGAGE